MLTIDIDENFKQRAGMTDFSLLNKAIGNGVYNVNQTKGYAPLFVKVCNLYYFENDVILEAFGGMDSNITYKCKSL